MTTKVGLTLQEMRDLVRKGMGGLSVQQMPDPEVDRYLNMSFWEQEFNLDFKEKECRVEFQTTEGENRYQLPDPDDTIDLEAIQSVMILDEDDNTYDLTRMTERKWDDLYSHPDDDAHALPARYLREDETMVLHPTPDRSDYTVRLFFLKSLQELIAEEHEKLDLPRNWDEIVVEGAVWRAHFYNGDYNLARQAMNFQIGQVRSATSVRAKEEDDSRYAGLDVAWDDPHGGHR